MAVFDIGWITLGPNASVDWFIHGYNANQAVAYSISVFPGSGAGVPFPAAKAAMTVIQYSQATDGTFAQTVHIQNNAPFNSCDIHLLSQVESL